MGLEYYKKTRGADEIRSISYDAAYINASRLLRRPLPTSEKEARELIDGHHFISFSGWNRIEDFQGIVTHDYPKKIFVILNFDNKLAPITYESIEKMGYIAKFSGVSIAYSPKKTNLVLWYPKADKMCPSLITYNEAKTPGLAGDCYPVELISTEEKKEGNNHGRSECIWCEGRTKTIDLFTSKTQICPVCEKP